MVGDPDTQTPADWTTLFGQVVLIRARAEATGPQHGGSVVPSGWRMGGPWFCQNGARQTTRWPRRWSSPTERRVSPCVHKQLDACTSVSDWHIRGNEGAP